MNNQKVAYSEVYTILQMLDGLEYNKIPYDVIEAIKENRSKEYTLGINSELELKNQNLLPKTKAILAVIYRDYLASPEEKEEIKNRENEERKKNEIEKRKKYNIDVFANNIEINKNIKEETSLQVTENKENILKRILNKIKLFFNNRLK